MSFNNTTYTSNGLKANIHFARTDDFSAVGTGAAAWTVKPVAVTGAGWSPFNSTVPNIGESNPSVTLLQSGRSLLVFRSHLKGGYWPGVEGEHTGFALGNSLMQTQYKVSGNLSWGQPASGNDEDGFVWQQQDGTLHCLYHNGECRGWWWAPHPWRIINYGGVRVLVLGCCALRCDICSYIPAHAC